MEFKKQFNDKATSTYLVMGDVPLINTNESLCQLKDVDSPVDGKFSNITMTTQVNKENISINIREDQLLRVPYRQPNHRSHNM